MWDASSIPGVERVLPGTLKGYSREMCIKSFIYRGTREKPGLCMGLLRCPDGECEGMVLQLDQAQLADTLQRIDRRELVMGAYTRERVIVVAQGVEIPCYTYVVNRAADNYTGDISDEEKTRLICTGVGQNGPSIEYLSNLVAQLEGMGIDPGKLHDLLRYCQQRLGQEAAVLRPHS
ncbi:hypothetical protein FOZ60_014997 [Perkinsus olseni]|uniref:glutathione-specific gamma-glutamylcyclotransferase n=1 Tax=Perkinsus olseni TaxID=32597 RepID=A0A7J6P698_PEROL|nr:hypothetical protein FOZ60_014997 [Perkinsus olseni]